MFALLKTKITFFLKNLYELILFYDLLIKKLGLKTLVSFLHALSCAFLTLNEIQRFSKMLVSVFIFKRTISMK